MVFISATRLRVKSFINLPSFFMANEASAKQLIKTPGLLAGKELIDKHFVCWMLTYWKDVSDMKIFRNSEPHRKAMQKLPFWCNEATYIHRTEENYAPISWEKVYLEMIAEGRISKVRNPSAQHLLKSFPSIIWTKLERTLKAG